MAQRIMKVLSCDVTEGFGKVADGKTTRNLVVRCTFGQESMFAVTGEHATFSANMSVPETFWEKHDRDTKVVESEYRKALEKALADGVFVLFGHIFSVSELTDGEYKTVYNTTTKHTIEVFTQALETDDADTAKSFLRRALTRQIENKKFLWQKPE